MKQLKQGRDAQALRSFLLSKFNGEDMEYKWIDVDDKLPETQETYLVAFSSEGAGIDVDSFNVKTGQWDFYNKDDMAKVKFWTSISKPDWREHNE